MSSFWETKYLNSEKSIQFLQETHEEILNGLHQEIDNLQKQCSEFALKLSLQASTAVEREEYDKKFKSLNAEYKKKDELILEQKKLIDERNKNIKSLQERIKSLEKKFESETNSKETIIKQLKAKLEAQSNQLANLTYQLHHINRTKQNDYNNKLDESLHESTTTAAAAVSVATNSDRMPSAKLLLLDHLPTKLSNKKKHNTTRTTQESVISSTASNELDQPNVESIKLKYSSHSNNIASSLFEIRRNSSQSIRSISPLGLEQQNETDHNNKSKETISHHNNRTTSRSTSSNSNVSRSERSDTTPPPIFQKVLPPVIKRPSEIIPPPDPKPFLQSSASTLHTRAKKDILQRRTLISLPPIKPFEISHLAVESPLKMTRNTSLASGPSANLDSDHNNNTNK